MKVMFFTAPWCGACQQAKPFVEREATNRGVDITYVDVDAEPETANAHGVRGLPTVIILDDAGEVRDMIAASQIHGRLPAALRGS